MFYYALLSLCLLDKCTCLASDFKDNFILILSGSDLDIYIKTAIGCDVRKYLPLILVVFLTVPAVNMINARNINVVVH